MKRKLMLATAFAVASTLAGAQGYGPGMMGGSGGYGPGMMGGGYGPGMMGGYASGMMGGYGRGMMGGFAGGGPGLAALNLSDEQQEKVFAIQEEQRRKNFDTMSKMRSETFKLRRMYTADNVDSKAVVEQQRRVDDLRRQMLASRLEMRKQVESVLTPEQKKQIRQLGPWWAREESED